MRYRVYGRIINTWTAFDEKRGREVMTQCEIEYKEYNEAGELVATGTEDFSRERYKTVISQKFVFTWDGQKRNKGGYRWFERCEYVTYRKHDAKAIKAHFKRIHNAELVELR